MGRQEAVMQYMQALKAGQKYYKNAVSNGESPYPPALDDIIDMKNISSTMELGLINVPSELVIGTKTAGRTSALSGDFMPLLGESTEFGVKWINLCEAHLSDEGIRDPIKCYEYMGLFYVQEGNKRASVLKSYGAPTIPAIVTRLVPEHSEEHSIQVYYEFMEFYSLSGLYGVCFNHRKQYAKLIAKLGFDMDHVWTEAERRSFSAGFTHFRSAFEKVRPEESNVTPAGALLVFLSIYSFPEIKAMAQKDIAKQLSAMWEQIEAEDNFSLDLNTEPIERESGIINKILSLGRAEGLKVAFIYAFDVEISPWTKSHDLGREYLEKQLDSRVDVKVYTARNFEYYAAMEEAVQDGAEIIFATTPNMIDACRRIAALYPNTKVLNCSLSRPHPGVRNYYCRMYEAKFISGAIAGAMADTDRIGYVANYPIMGVPAAINAFAAGVKLTNPRAKIKLTWSCTEGDPVKELIDAGVSVISKRDAINPKGSTADANWGTYKLLENGTQQPLGLPCWNWGPMYEKIVLSVFSGAWSDPSLGLAVNYWWGIKTGAIDITFSDALPSGVRRLANILKTDIINEIVYPFDGVIIDNEGNIRNDGIHSFTPEEIMAMDWLLDNVDGSIPGFEELIPASRDTVRLLGTYRFELPPEKEEEKQI